ncbi:MAG: PD-(D/E)XK nuclease family protein [Candidatus Paceibacterota bacterium]
MGLGFNTGELMSPYEKPNLFRYATSELSQDAFIAWLASWANPKLATINDKLHNSGKKLIAEFLTLHDKALPSIDKLEVLTQKRRVDVLIIINDTYYIIIEDKIFTKSHSNQLEKYLTDVKGFYKVDKKYIIPIYFKTGDQCSYQKVIDNKYKVYTRQMFLNLLNEGVKSGIKNDIYLAYYQFLQILENQVEAFRYTKVKEWESFSKEWIGLHKEFKKVFEDGFWEPVNSPSKKFHAFWWNRRIIREHEIYLQNEGGKLCFKVCQSREEKGNVDPEIKKKLLSKVKIIYQ